MYQSEIQISQKTKAQNLQRIRKHIENTKYATCGPLRRKSSLEKFIEANIYRKDSAIRFATFFCALDVAKRSKNIISKRIDGKRCFEIIGKSADEKIVKIHFREEQMKTGKQLFFISCFYDKK